MRKRDMDWLNDNRWYHFDGLIPVIHEDAPQEVKDSFRNYCDQLAEEYSEETETQRQLDLISYVDEGYTMACPECGRGTIERTLNTYYCSEDCGWNIHLLRNRIDIDLGSDE